MRKKEKKHGQGERMPLKIRLLICAAVIFGFAVQELKCKIVSHRG